MLKDYRVIAKSEHAGSASKQMQVQNLLFSVQHKITSFSFISDA